MNLQLLKSFLVVAECKNFTHAAHFLNFTQPAISGHITALEKLYEVTLFQRDGKNVYLTDAGIAFRENAKKIIDEYEHSLEKMELFSQSKKTLRIAISTQLINYLLMDNLYKLHQHFPDLVIEVHRCMTIDTTIKETFTDKIYDIAFVHLDVQPLYTKRKFLCEQQIVWVVNQTLYQKHQSSDNIADYPLISYPKSSVYYKIKDHFDFSQFASTFTYSDSESVKLAVKKGLGVALLPEIKIKDELHSQELIRISSDLSVNLPISLLYQQNMVITPHIKYLFSLLNDNIKYR